MKNLLQKADWKLDNKWVTYSELVRAGFSEDQSLDILLMEAGTDHTHYNPHEVRDLARKMWVVYNGLVEAGFSEDQALAMLLTKKKREKLERIQ